MNNKSENTCSHLEIEDLYSQLGHNTTRLDSLGQILKMQKNTQELLYGYNFQDMNIGEVVEFLHMNNHAFQDEVHEMFDALGGIKDGNGNAAWKPWKAKHQETKAMKLTDLSKNDLKELHMEFVDMLHFFMNYAIALNLDAKTIFNYYFAKNKENHDRQERNY